jgi:hypothetical protein
VIPVISLSQAWRPFLLSLVSVTAHHAYLGLVDPAALFGLSASRGWPLFWVGVHALFVVAASAVCVLPWGIIERGSRLARRQVESSERRFRPSSRTPPTSCR